MKNEKVKKYLFKIFHKKAGQSDANAKMIIDGIWVTSKQEAFADGRKELIRIAECDRNGNNDSEINDIIASINAGRSNFNYDTNYYSISVVSKKMPKNSY